jgi:hypothetical protein
VVTQGALLVAGQQFGDHQRIGDGRVDVRDFRRWRDWLLQAEGVGQLDGAPDHPKKDLNGDSVANDPRRPENVYPRGDFNGDGIISRTATAKVPGFAAPVTDLQVFQRLGGLGHPGQGNNVTWTYDQLVDSGDLWISVRNCAPDVPTFISNLVTIEVWPGGQAPPPVGGSYGRMPLLTALTGRIFPVDQVLTLPHDPAGYVVRVIPDIVWSRYEERTLAPNELRLGTDVPWAPTCPRR